MKRRNLISSLVTVVLASAVVPRALKAALVPAENESNTKIWVTRDGRKIRIVDLTDDHLRNCIFYLSQRNGMMNIWEEEIARGFAVEFSQLSTWERWPIFDDLLREADRRKLTWSHV